MKGDRPILKRTELGLERMCIICEEFWPLDGEFFYRDRSGHAGFMPRCKACHEEKYHRKREVA